MAKYDWYDPNTEAKGMEIGVTNLTEADIKYSTLGLGLTRYFTPNLKVLAYYAIVKNEKTSLPDYTSDLEDNVFTLRMQLRFLRRESVVGVQKFWEPSGFFLFV